MLKEFFGNLRFKVLLFGSACGIVSVQQFFTKQVAISNKLKEDEDFLQSILKDSKKKSLVKD